jgi:phospholipase C
VSKPAWLSPTDPTERLDRWLLSHLSRFGAVRRTEFISAQTVQAGLEGVRLTSVEVETWLRSAFRRGLVLPGGLGLDGERLVPPLVRLTDLGRARHKRAQPLYASVPGLAWVGNQLLAPRAWRAAVDAFRLEQPHWDDHPLPRDPAPIRALKECSAEEADRNLQEKVKHIVVLMLENRSFDHMLGYLTLQGSTDVDGLTGQPDQVNKYRDKTYAPRHLLETRFPKSQDPCHSVACVQDQLDRNGPNGGFVENFAEVDQDHPELVMGFYSGDDLPVYDYLAHGFCICDAWHSSVPGSTWTNRVFALTGEEPPRESLFAADETALATNEEFFDRASFVRHLGDEDWRWYSHDPGTLRVVDGHYRLPKPGTTADLWIDNFRYFDKRTVGAVSRRVERWVVDEADSFLDDAREGGLSGLSWIDPNFIDLSIGERNSNDDHPPSDVRAGQRLVLDTVRALTEGPVEQWRETVLVITYDEHGGFYDHVPPPAIDGRRLGVRVPALIVSPWVEPGTVAKTSFEHASIIKTILTRHNPEALNDMPPRVKNAKHLGYVLTAAHPHLEVPDMRAVIAAMASDRAESAAIETALGREVPTDPQPLKDFPAEMVKASQILRSKHGLQAGQP